jgi:hypothetical protein
MLVQGFVMGFFEKILIIFKFVKFFQFLIKFQITFYYFEIFYVNFDAIQVNFRSHRM